MGDVSSDTVMGDFR